MRARAPRAGFVFVAMVLGLIACGPDPAPRVPSLYDEDFDSACAGVPCGWTQVAGAPAGAHSTDTLLPGLRALALEGDGVIVDGPPDPAARVGFVFTPLDLVLLARCDATASLTVRVALTSLSTPDGAIDAAATLLEARLRPEPTWNTDGTASAETRQTLVPLIAPSTTGTEVRIESVSIRKDGPGQCEIDSLRVEQPGFGDSFGSGTCG